MTPVIPESLRICRACEEDLAQANGLCVDCERVRFLLAAHEMHKRICLDPRCSCGVAHPELPPGLRFIGDGMTKTFEPVGYRPCDGVAAPVYEDPQFTVPRISEVPQAMPLPSSREAEAAARRITTWVGLLVLFAFASGWMFGRFG